MKKDDKIPGIFARLSLRKLVQIALLSAVCILLTVSTLAVREWYIHIHSSRLLEDSKVIMAHSREFSDYIIEQLLTNQIINMEEMEHEASIIGEKGSDLASQTLVPDEFKLLLIRRSDMAKLMARIRLLSTQPDGNEKRLVIYRMLRNINSRINTFDEEFDRYLQQQWQAIQNLLRGLLAIATMFLTMLLFLLHVYITRPFLRLISNIRKALGNKNTHHETDDSILAITHLGHEIRTELEACTLYKNILHKLPFPDPSTDFQHQPGELIWKLAAPLLQQHPHYKLVSVSFFNDDTVGKKIPDYLREEVQNRGIVIFQETDDLTFSRMRKILPCAEEIHAGICFSISSASERSGMITIFSNDPESFSEQEVTTLSTLLQFLEYIDSYSTAENSDETGFPLEELRAISFSLLNEQPPHRGCHNIMNHANGIINCAQIMRDQDAALDLQEDESQKLMTDLWESGQKIAAAVNQLRSLQQLYTNPVVSVEDSITLLLSWLELQFPEISQILKKKNVPPLPPLSIPGRDLFLVMALQAEQLIPEPGRDYGSCIFDKLQIETYIQSETEVVIEMTLQLKAGELPGSNQDTALHLRRLICNKLLNCYKSNLEISRIDNQSITYRFILR